jgi:hypothetical protein
VVKRPASPDAALINSAPVITVEVRLSVCECIDLLMMIGLGELGMDFAHNSWGNVVLFASKSEVTDFSGGAGFASCDGK